MYEQFFQLKKNPFLMTPDPACLFLTESHREALAGLTYAVLNGKSLVVFTGEAGTGKTTLLRAVWQAIAPDRARFCFVTNPQLTPNEFLEIVLMEAGLNDIPSSKTRRIYALRERLVTLHRQGITTVLAVDEAHRLDAAVLEEIRLLANLELADCKLMPTVLAGHTQLLDLLSREDAQQLNQRVALRFTLGPLSEPEVERYLAHRWVAAGAAGPAPFSSDALRLIARWSRGVPRLVNAISDNALLVAYGSGVPSVRTAHVDEAVADLGLRTGAPGANATAPAPSAKFLDRDGRPPGSMTLMPVPEGLQPPVLMRWAQRLRLGTVQVRL